MPSPARGTATSSSSGRAARRCRQRSDGGGTIVIVWARTVGSGTPVRVGDRVELSGIVLVDNLPGQAAGSDVITNDNVSGRLANCPRARGCTAPLFIATSFRPAPAGRRNELKRRMDAPRGFEPR